MVLNLVVSLLDLPTEMLDNRFFGPDDMLVPIDPSQELFMASILRLKLLLLLANRGFLLLDLGS